MRLRGVLGALKTMGKSPSFSTSASMPRNNIDQVSWILGQKRLVPPVAEISGDQIDRMEARLLETFGHLPPEATARLYETGASEPDIFELTDRDLELLLHGQPNVARDDGSAWPEAHTRQPAGIDHAPDNIGIKKVTVKIAAVTLAIVTLLGGINLAASRARHDGPLFSLKVMLESLRYEVAWGNLNKASVRIDIAEDRLGILRSAEGDPRTILSSSSELNASALEALHLIRGTASSPRSLRLRSRLIGVIESEHATLSIIRARSDGLLRVIATSSLGVTEQIMYQLGLSRLDSSGASEGSEVSPEVTNTQHHGLRPARSAARSSANSKLPAGGSQGAVEPNEENHSTGDDCRVDGLNTTICITVPNVSVPIP